MSEKIQPRHLGRKAMLYVRQSSAFQVSHNLESQKLQYAMQTRLHDLGFSDIEVVDEDLGRSAAGIEARRGFERMVAEVSLGRVGAVAAREVSRFARNSRDWQQLVEVCRIVDTLLVDQEMVYDPRLGNDRLLLGLKGSLNEYELDLLRQRSLEARRAKARRGELIVMAPVGFRKSEDRRLEKDPDRRVQEAIRLVFEQFEKIASVRQTLLWFLEHDLQLPAVAGNGEVRWKRPVYGTVYQILTNPAYGGAYAYGKSESRTHLVGGELRYREYRKPRAQWQVLIPKAHEGYVDWTQFERIQGMIHGNVIIPGGRSGPPRSGKALLGALLRCRRCATKLTIKYSGRGGQFIRYSCHRGHMDKGLPRCIDFAGDPVDAAVGAQIMRVVQPAAIEAATIAYRNEMQKQDEVLGAFERELEAARYTAQRAQRQYDAADPENRLVADELERRWNQALEHVREVEARIAQHHIGLAQVPAATAEEFSALADQLEEIWEHPETDMRLKKRIVRSLIHEIVVDIDQQACEIVLIIHWKGGLHTEVHVPRRRRGQHGSQTAPETLDAVRMLARICTDDFIANVLNRNGRRTGYGNFWTRERVTALRSYHDIPVFSAENSGQEGWMNLTDAARSLGISQRTLRLAVEHGELSAEHPLAIGPWVFKRETLQGKAALELVERVRTRRADPAIPPDQQALFD